MVGAAQYAADEASRPATRRLLRPRLAHVAPVMLLLGAGDDNSLIPTISRRRRWRLSVRNLASVGGLSRGSNGIAVDPVRLEHGQERVALPAEGPQLQFLVPQLSLQPPGPATLQTRATGLNA